MIQRKETKRSFVVKGMNGWNRKSILVFIIFTLQREWENLAELPFSNILLLYFYLLMNLYVVSYYLSCCFDFPRVSKTSVGSL